ncbi:AAA family ATPase [Desulfocurvibacter africanus]|uniref:AAA ATPase central domain protein n=1 Tax=Desulfocurvibacter africanus subsp. africanus str. Walvis Bay TaxID=690850 RepID=F3YY80_DESAF|nr:ATP-binding protein [Desulfocurvibacter africanus]EGJ51856.1 AAA ATPase central domain protein [Desulfocurvibacter africanus subsp. africanus str. Walvis Bay]
MATTEQLKSLIRSHVDDDRERFLTIALQVAAHEAKLGRSEIAHDIRKLVDQAKAPDTNVLPFKREFSDLILTAAPKERLASMILSEDRRKRIERIIREYHQQSKLKQHGLSNRRKILLAGPPGTGKTMTAMVLAGELHLPLYTILMDKLITKFMGETSAKLRQIFDIIRQRRGVYLFDEFDAIGAERGLPNDVGEMRRVLNSFLQFIEQDSSESLIIAATNNVKMLDHALFRRFDDILHYDLPSLLEIQNLIANRLGQFLPKRMSLGSAASMAKSLSHAEVGQACDDAIKDAILSGKQSVSVARLKDMLRERQSVYRKNHE